MATPEGDTDTSTPSLHRRPSRLVVAGGGVAAAVTVASGIGAAVIGGEDPHADTRRVFTDVPVALQVAFYVAIPALIIASAWLLAGRVRNWERGQAEDRKTTAANRRRRLDDLWRGLSMRTVWADRSAGVIHSLIYFPFLVLFAVTATLELDHLLPNSWQFLHGVTYEAYKFVGDTAGLLFVVGVVAAMVRRYVRRPYRLRIKTRPEDGVILGLLLLIGLSGPLVQGARIALDGRPAFEAWGYLGWGVSAVVSGWSHGALMWLHRTTWTLHVALFGALLMVLPTTKLRHAVISPVNMYLRQRERPKGAMRALPDLTTTELDTFGAKAIEDFTWKQLLDTDSCTICGRCTSVCPAHATGKPLDPREIVTKIGNVMAATRPRLEGTVSPDDPSAWSPVSPVISQDAELKVAANSVFERITAEEVWSCTSCRACDEICPVNIEILDKILDMRRYLSLMESDFPASIGTMYRSLENQENPWGLANSSRGAWAEGLPEVAIAQPGQPVEHEYLYWVGCAGSFDDKNKKVTRAVASLLTRAGVDFAILGPSERCTGDPARRSGNEYLFQMMAGANIETFAGMRVKKIITQCPHCFNTLRNEYPQLGGDYEVVHHSQLLEELIASGRLDLAGASLPERIVYHDSCYLGRHNDVYQAPRKVLGALAGIDIIEAPRSGTRSMCCGAGGARMWMEESVGKRINAERTAELMATGAQRIATACPFCYIMIDDGAKAAKRDDVVVADIAIHLAEAIERAQPS
jgi:Fe-S oxidoreductase/nitrate reductase gamma subunit